MIERLIKLLKLAEGFNLIYSFYFERLENELEFSISHENDEDTIKSISECIINVVKGYGIKIEEVSQESGWICCEDEEFAEPDYETFTLKLEINEEEKCML